MTKQDDLLRLHHMRDHAKEAIELAGRRTEAEIAENRVLILALTRLIEIVGEAASRIFTETKKRFNRRSLA